VTLLTPLELWLERAVKMSLISSHERTSSSARYGYLRDTQTTLCSRIHGWKYLKAIWFVSFFSTLLLFARAARLIEVKIGSSTVAEKLQD
jgi:hypothetical protein